MGGPANKDNDGEQSSLRVPCTVYAAGTSVPRFRKSTGNHAQRFWYLVLHVDARSPTVKGTSTQYHSVLIKQLARPDFSSNKPGGQLLLPDCWLCTVEHPKAIRSLRVPLGGFHLRDFVA